MGGQSLKVGDRGGELCGKKRDHIKGLAGHGDRTRSVRRKKKRYQRKRQFVREVGLDGGKKKVRVERGYSILRSHFCTIAGPKEGKGKKRSG